jgi:hypothetical protein
MSRQEADMLAAGVRHDDFYVDKRVSVSKASHTQFGRAFDALQAGTTW